MSELLATAIGAAATATGTGIACWYANRQSRDRLAHERALAQEERRQARIERAYLGVLGAVNGVSRLIETDATNKVAPDYEAAEALIDPVWTELDAFGSHAVREAFDKWRSGWLVFKMDMPNARLQGALDRVDRSELKETRRLALEAAEALRTQIAAELRGAT